MRRNLVRFYRDRSGVIGSVSVLAIIGTLGLAALSYNVSQFYFMKRRQQGMTDLAALAAAANLTAAQKAAQTSLLSNNFAATDLQSVETGIYVADAHVPVGQRFTPTTGAAANAVRVTVRTHPKGFLSVLVFSRGVQVDTQAIAANGNVATFAVNPPLPGLDPAVANGILGGLIGNAISLTTADYLGLGSASIDPFALAKAVATRVGFTGTYAELARTSIRLSDLFAAIATVLADHSAPQIAVSAMRVVAAATRSVGPRLTFGNLIAFDGFATRTVDGTAAISTKLPLLPLITAAGRLAAATVGNMITVPVTTLASGLSPAKFVLVTNIPKATSTFAAIGPTGTSVRTLETRAAIALQLPGVSNIASISLALYVQTQAATARLATLNAGANGTTSATLGIVPGVSTAWIGSVPDTALTNWSVTPQPGYAPLVDTPLLKVSGLAQSTVGTTSETLVTFSADDIAACRMKTVTGDGILTPLTSLLSSLKLQVSVLGLGFGTETSVIKSVNGALQNSLTPVANTINSTMSFLGLNLGNVGSWVCSARSGQAHLVN